MLSRWCLYITVILYEILQSVKSSFCCEVMILSVLQIIHFYTTVYFEPQMLVLNITLHFYCITKLSLSSTRVELQTFIDQALFVTP